MIRRSSGKRVPMDDDPVLTPKPEEEDADTDSDDDPAMNPSTGTKLKQPSKFEQMCDDDIRKNKLGKETPSKSNVVKCISTNFSWGGLSSKLSQRCVLSVAISLGTFLLWFVIAMLSAEKAPQLPTSTGFNWNKAQKQLLQSVRLISNQFPNQAKETPVHFLSTINSTLSEVTPKQPSAITVLVPPAMKTSSFPICYLSKVANIINEILSKVLGFDTVLPFKTLNKAYFDKNGGDITKIHAELNEYFRKGGRAVMVHDVEKLQEEKHLNIFHSLCDNSNANEKRATVLFSLPVPESVYEKYEWDNDNAAEISQEILDLAWKEVLSKDSIPAYISRIAATVVVLNEGDRC